MILKVDGIEFSYNSRTVLSGIKFNVQKGEFLSILGNNGAGKSTLLKCINRILKTQKGTVLIDGSDISRLNRLEMAQKIGYVAQKYENSRFTVFDAVLLGRRPYIKWDVSAKDIEIVDTILETFGLKEFALRYLDELSGGELQNVVKQYVRQQNIAAIVVMHDLNLALRFSDKFLLLKDRAIFAGGGVEIMTPENIASVYGIPVTLERFNDVPVVVPL